MKTIKEAADYLGVSTQTVYKKINTTHRRELKPHIQTIRNCKYITETGIDIIRESLPYLVTRENGENEFGERQSDVILNTKKRLKIKFKDNAAGLRDIGVLNADKYLKLSLNTAENRIEELRHLNDELQNQLNIEREYNRKLNDDVVALSRDIAQITVSMAELTRNNQVLLGNEQNNNSLVEPVGPVGPVGPTGPQGMQGMQGMQGTSKKFWQFWK